MADLPASVNHRPKDFAHRSGITRFAEKISAPPLNQGHALILIVNAAIQSRTADQRLSDVKQRTRCERSGTGSGAIHCPQNTPSDRGSGFHKLDREPIATDDFA